MLIETRLYDLHKFCRDVGVNDTCDYDLFLVSQVLSNLGSDHTVGSAMPYATFSTTGEVDPSAGDETSGPPYR